MAKADGVVVEELLTAARAAIADPALRALLVAEAVDDVDEAHLRMRTDLFRKMPGLQRMVLTARRMKAATGSPVPATADRALKIEAVRASAARYCVDAAAVEALIEVADRIDDAGLVALREDFDKLALVQRKDLELLLDMDRRAGARATPVAERAATAEDKAVERAARQARFTGEAPPRNQIR